MACAAFLAVGGPALQAQESQPGVPLTACVDHLPPSAFFRVAVYAYVDVDPALGRQARFAGEDFLQTVVEAGARLLGSTSDSLPRGDSTLTWREVKGDLRVTAYPDGRMTWTPDSEPDHPTGATRLLARAVGAARASGAAVVLPEDKGGKPLDSLTFTIRTTHPRVDHTGRAGGVTVHGAAVPIFSASVPWLEGGEILPGQGHPVVPDDAGRAISGGLYITVATRFVVDTLGRVVPASLHDLWSDRVQRPTGERARDLDEVSSAVHRWLLRIHFAPHNIGGCLEPFSAGYDLAAGYPPGA